MSPAEREACDRLTGRARLDALAAFKALDSLAVEVDSFCADVSALVREVDGATDGDDIDNEWSSLQRKAARE